MQTRFEVWELIVSRFLCVSICVTKWSSSMIKFTMYSRTRIVYQQRWEHLSCEFTWCSSLSLSMIWSVSSSSPSQWVNCSCLGKIAEHFRYNRCCILHGEWAKLLDRDMSTFAIWIWKKQNREEKAPATLHDERGEAALSMHEMWSLSIQGLKITYKNTCFH